MFGSSTLHRVLVALHGDTRCRYTNGQPVVWRLRQWLPRRKLGGKRHARYNVSFVRRPVAWELSRRCMNQITSSNGSVVG
jgi:hypothetical protein